ncbi:unnamed protein product [marine sediment metagenome]|uniref:Uncharacterized protein n=1 Tax=marine sediment metagenome TaxID=412755 RepID=X1DH37_9ZZZZ
MSFEERIQEIREDISRLARRRIKSALWEGDLDLAEELMIDLQRRELCQAYLDKIESEEVEAEV